MKILLVGDPILRQPTELVTVDDYAQYVAMVPEMEKAMLEAAGLGLAANQVGIAKRFFIMGWPEQNTPTRIFINPELQVSTNKNIRSESCLSIPGVSADMERYNNITLTFRDENFVERKEEFTGRWAQAVQHELDHLDGILFVDKLSPMRKILVMKEYNQFIIDNERK